MSTSIDALPYYDKQLEDPGEHLAGRSISKIAR
jgi:hypothetical protein